MKQHPSNNPTTWLVAGALALVAGHALAVDRNWIGGAASYNTPANWTGGVVPGLGDTALNNNGPANAVQINVGNPDWSVDRIIAGNGAFVQNGQMVTLPPGVRSIRLGTTPVGTGIYTLNDGTLFYTNAMVAIGEIGAGILNVYGGSLTGNGVLAINAGDSEASATATMDGGFAKTGHTWFSQGFYTPDPSIGLPPEGSTFSAVANANYSFKMAPSYTANNVMMVYADVPAVTVTLPTPSAYSLLSFLGSAGNTPGGAMQVSYTIHHADNSTQSGTLSIQDWFPGDKTNLAIETRGRVQANGTLVQIIADNPSLLYHDVVVNNTTSPITSVDLAHISGIGVTCIAAVSGSTGGNVEPITITGYNADMIVEPVAKVDESITSTFNQTGGVVTINNEMWVGNGGNGIYHLSGGTNSVGNWFAVGRSGGDGVINMSGGVLNKNGGGNLLIGSGYQSPIGGTPSGLFNLSGGTLNVNSGELLIPENSPATGTFNLSGTGVVNVNNWLAVGRGGGAGVLNLTNGVINKTGGGNIVVGAGGLGEVNHYGGTISNANSQTWVGEGFQATWNMYGGQSYLGLLRIAQGGGSASYFNLNGGLLSVSEISANTGAYSELNLNGGTIQARGNNGNFMHDILFANLGAGGVTFDSQEYDIVVSQNFTDNGGGNLTKIGSGSLTLSGNAAYSGATFINGGRLQITTASGGGSYTMAAGTRYSLAVLGLNQQVPMTSLTINAGAGATLDFDMGLYGVNTQAPVAVSGALTANGTITINVPTGAFSAGTIPLISYSSSAGAATFVTGTLPVGVVGYITNNTAANQVQLVVTAAAAPRWDGTVNGNWDINTTANWVDLATASPAVFQNGNPVVLDDQATGTTDITLIQDVSVSGILVTNATLPYSIKGTKAIGGTATLTKQGTGTLALGTTNTFTGATVIQNGTLIASNLANGGLPSAIGAASASAANLVIENGTLSYAGPATTINRGVTLNGNNSTIETLGNLNLTGGVVAGNAGRFRKSGAATLTYTGSGSNQITGNVNPGLNVIEGAFVFSGTGAGMTNRIQNDLHVGGTPNLPATMALTNTHLVLGAWLGVGRGNGNSGVTSSLTLHNSSINANGISFGWWNNLAGNFAFQNITLSGTSTITNRGGNGSNFAESGGSTTTVNILDNSEFASVPRLLIASGGEAGAGTGVVQVAQSGKLWVNSYLSIGNENGKVGYLTAKDNASVYAAGDFNVSDTGSSIGNLTIQDNATVSGNAVYVGKGGATIAHLNLTGGTLIGRTTGQNSLNVAQSSGSVATVNQSGGTVIVSGEFWPGASGTANWTQTGGTTTSTNWIAIGRNTSGVGHYRISGGSLNHINGDSRLIVGSSGNGTLTISNTAAVNAVGQVQIGENGSSTGVLNLDGGTLTAPRVYGGTGNRTLNFNGGTLVARPGAVLNFIAGLTNAVVKSGGAIIDSGTNVVAVNSPLRDGTGGGGLTKQGSGTLFLNSINTYTGNTAVNQGALGGIGTIAGTVNVAAGAALAPGNTDVGTLTISGDLNLTGNWRVKLNTNGNDQVVVSGNITKIGAGTVDVTNLGVNFSAGAVFTLANKPVVNGNLFTVTGGGVTWENRLAIDGTIVALTGTVSTTPVPLVSAVNGNTLNLSWPADHTGWRLEVQTNSLAVGLSGTWSTWPGSQATNQVFVPINPANPTVFFRLVYP